MEQGAPDSYLAEDKRARAQQGTHVYLRSGFDLTRGTRERHEFVTLSRTFRLDLKYLAKVYAVANRGTMLVKQQVTSVFASWDASTSWGMGGFLDGRWFSE